MAYTNLSATYFGYRDLIIWTDFDALAENDAYLYTRMCKVTKAEVSGAGGTGGTLATILEVSGAGVVHSIIALSNAAATPMRVVVTVDGVAMLDATISADNGVYAWIANDLEFEPYTATYKWSGPLDLRYATTLKIEACRTDAGVAPTVYVSYAEAAG